MGSSCRKSPNSNWPRQRAELPKFILERVNFGIFPSPSEEGMCARYARRLNELADKRNWRNKAILREAGANQRELIFARLQRHRVQNSIRERNSKGQTAGGHAIAIRVTVRQGERKKLLKFADLSSPRKHLMCIYGVDRLLRSATLDEGAPRNQLRVFFVSKIFCIGCCGQ